MAREKLFKEKDSILFHLEKEEKNRTYDLLERVQERVGEYNEKIHQRHGGGTTPSGKPTGHTLFALNVTVAATMRTLVQELLEQYEQDPDALLARLRPEIAIDLGILTRREAIREGFIPLTKIEVLNGEIALSELPRDVLERLNFSPEELRTLQLRA